RISLLRKTKRDHCRLLSAKSDSALQNGHAGGCRRWPKGNVAVTQPGRKIAKLPQANRQLRPDEIGGPPLARWTPEHSTAGSQGSGKHLWQSRNRRKAPHAWLPRIRFPIRAILSTIRTIPACKTTHPRPTEPVAMEPLQAAACFRG